MDGSSRRSGATHSSRGRESESSHHETTDDIVASPRRDRSIRGRATTFVGRQRKQPQQQQQASSNGQQRMNPSRPSLAREGSNNNSSRWLSDTSHSFKRNLPGRASSAKAPTMPGRPKRSTDSDNEGSDEDDDEMDISDIVNNNSTRSRPSGDLGRHFGRSGNTSISHNDNTNQSASVLSNKSPKALRVPRRRVTEPEEVSVESSKNKATFQRKPYQPQKQRKAPSSRRVPASVANQNDDAQSVTSANTVPTSNTTATKKNP